MKLLLEHVDPNFQQSVALIQDRNIAKTQTLEYLNGQLVLDVPWLL